MTNSSCTPSPNSLRVPKILIDYQDIDQFTAGSCLRKDRTVERWHWSLDTAWSLSQTVAHAVRGDSHHNQGPLGFGVDLVSDPFVAALFLVQSTVLAIRIENAANGLITLCMDVCG